MMAEEDDGSTVEMTADDTRGAGGAGAAAAAAD